MFSESTQTNDRPEFTSQTDGSLWYKRVPAEIKYLDETPARSITVRGALNSQYVLYVLDEIRTNEEWIVYTKARVNRG